MDLLNSKNFKVAITQLSNVPTGLKPHYMIAYQKLHE